jgi:hypothetical protein
MEKVMSIFSKSTKKPNKPKVIVKKTPKKKDDEQAQLTEEQLEALQERRSPT